MSHDRFDARINEVLDGAASAADRAALEREMSADPELRRRFDALRSLFDTLGGIQMSDPPADLHDDIVRSIERENARPAAPGWMESLAMAFRSRPIPAYAMTLVSVAAVGLLLYAASRQPANVTDLPVTATMAPAAPAAATLAAGDARLEIRTAWSGSELVITVTGEAPSGARLALRYDEASWTPAAPDGSPELSVQGSVQSEMRLALAGATVTPIHLNAETSAGNKEIRLPIGRQASQH